MRIACLREYSCGGRVIVRDAQPLPGVGPLGVSVAGTAVPQEERGRHGGQAAPEGVPDQQERWGQRLLKLVGGREHDHRLAVAEDEAEERAHRAGRGEHPRVEHYLGHQEHLREEVDQRADDGEGQGEIPAREGRAGGRVGRAGKKRELGEWEAGREGRVAEERRRALNNLGARARRRQARPQRYTSIIM